jgi:hypothetical protein
MQRVALIHSSDPLRSQVSTVDVSRSNFGIYKYFNYFTGAVVKIERFTSIGIKAFTKLFYFGKFSFYEYVPTICSFYELV